MKFDKKSNIFITFTENIYMKKNNLMSGMLVLAVGSVLAKLFSAIYRIALTRVLGGEGIGLYQLIFPLYSLCVVLATAGLPMAISKVIAKHKNAERAVVKKCVFMISVVSIVLTLILILSSRGLAVMQGAQEIYICYIILAPSIIFVAIASVLRGYFQGVQNFNPSAISNIVEQFVKLVLGLILSIYLVRWGLIASIVGAVVGILVSEIVSVLVLWLTYRRQNKSSEHIDINVKEIVVDILPITLTNIILPIATFVDSLLVVNLLEVSFNHSMAVFLYGLESGAVSSLVGLPTIFSFAIASVLLPNIAKNGSNGDAHLTLAIKVVLIISLPCVLAFIFMPDRLINLLYGDRLNGYGVEGVNVCYRLLAISGLGVVFLAVSQVFSTALQAVDKRYVTIRNLVIGVVVKFVIEVIFLPSIAVNIFALAIANTACYITMMVLNYIEIREQYSMLLEHDFWGKLTLANVLLVVVLLGVLSIGSSAVNTLMAIGLAGVVYLFALYRCRIICKTDIAIMKYKVK